MGLFFPDTVRSAEFSADRKHRYVLRRVWREQAAALAFLLLNPSDADEHRDDPTADRVEERAKRLGYGSVYIVNVFAYVTPFPSTLARMAASTDVVGPDNNAHIINVLAKSTQVICGWGAFPSLRERFDEVLQILKANAVMKVHHLGLTAGGHPRHPLYIPYAVQPIRWRI